MNKLLVIPVTLVSLWAISTSATPKGKSSAQFSLKTKEWTINKLGRKPMLASEQQATPVRRAEGRVTVRKSTYVVGPDGTYDYVSQNICEVTTSVDVYDFRNAPPDAAMAAGPTGSCDVTYNGIAAKVDFFGIGLLNRARLHASDVAESDLKIFSTVAYIYDPTGMQEGEVIPNNLFMTRDLNAVSSIAYMSQPSYVVCLEEGDMDPAPRPIKPASVGGGSTQPPGNCRPTRDESFSVIFEITDTP